MKKFKKIIVATVAILVVSLALVAFDLVGSKSARAYPNPAAVTLSTAGNFAILAGTPNITDAGGASVIVGDVGLRPAAGSGIGLTCSQVTGTIYSVDASGPAPCVVQNDDLLNTAKINLGTAYGDAAGRSVDFTAAPELGGTTKTAGVYDSTDTTFQITAGAGPLVLDGLGNSSSVFIFKMGFAGTGLTVGPGSIVSLVNGAQAKNVFWQVETATIDTTAVFKGNILALTSITVANGANIQGRLLARNGSVTLDHNIITTPTALHLRKTVINDNGGLATSTDWVLTATGTGGTDLASTTPVDSGSTFKAGTYTLGESGPSGYASSTYSCVNNGTTTVSNTITLATGDDVTCTITNNDIAPELHLRKTVTNDNGGTATSTEWTLTATGPGVPLTGFAPVDSDSTFEAGTYTLTESGGPSGYAASSTYICEKNGVMLAASSTIILAAGDDATCTITNNDIAPALHLIKVITGGTATFADFTLTANGTGLNDFSGTSPVNSGVGLLADTFALSETNPGGYTASAWSCVGGTQDGSNITLGINQEATCTITNTYIQTTSSGGGSSPVVQRILPIISITKIPSPLMLPNGPGLITYAYTVLNPGTVAMRDIKVTDDKCSNVTFVSGDSNNNSWLDTNETWKFTCASQITQTTKNIATVIGYDAGGMSATDVTNATVVVGQSVVNYTPVIIATPTPATITVATPTPIIPKLPNTGLNEINSSWYIIAIISVLSSLSLLYVIGKKHSD